MAQNVSPCRQIDTTAGGKWGQIGWLSGQSGNLDYIDMSTNREGDEAMSVQAVRGATTARADDAAAITEATVQLLVEMLGRNDIEPGQLISVVFTATPDLTAEFPAAAARTMGISDVPLLCAQEMAVPGSLPRCIRVLMHVHTARERQDLRHVYLNDATELRTDLAES